MNWVQELVPYAAFGGLLLSALNTWQARRSVPKARQRELHDEVRLLVYDIRDHLQARGPEDDHRAWLNQHRLERDLIPRIKDKKLKQALEDFLPEVERHEKAIQHWLSVAHGLRQARGEIGLDPEIPDSPREVSSPDIIAHLEERKDAAVAEMQALTPDVRARCDQILEVLNDLEKKP